MIVYRSGFSVDLSHLKDLRTLTYYCFVFLDIKVLVLFSAHKETKFKYITCESPVVLLRSLCWLTLYKNLAVYVFFSHAK